MPHLWVDCLENILRLINCNFSLNFFAFGSFSVEVAVTVFQVGLGWFRVAFCDDLYEYYCAQYIHIKIDL